MISEIYIIRYSGVLMYSYPLKNVSSGFNNKEFLTSSLLSTLSSIIRETMGEKIKEIILQNKRITLKFFNEYFVAVVASIEADRRFITKILSEISRTFNERFASKLNTNRISDFHEFAPEIEKIINKHKSNYMKLHDKYKSALETEVKRLFKFTKFPNTKTREWISWDN
ncbi:MAG: hypothetical protein ACTSSI_15970 [Candidatus Helarchaeota archaeon]